MKHSWRMQKCLINFSWWILMIFCRTFFPLHCRYLARSTTMLFIFICFTQNSEMGCGINVTSRWGWATVSTELIFCLRMKSKRFFSPIRFSIANNCKLFQFPAHSLFYVCALLCLPAGSNSDFMKHFLRQWLLPWQRNNINNANRFFQISLQWTLRNNIGRWLTGGCRQTWY